MKKSRSDNICNYLKTIDPEKLAALGTMAAGIIHEINQPLNSIRVKLDSILYCYKKYGEIDEKDFINKLEAISKEIQGMTGIITNIQSYVQRDEEDLKQNCDLNEIINNVLLKMEEEFKTKQIRIEKSLEKIPSIQGNIFGLESLIINLLCNAIQAFSKDCKSKVVQIGSFFKEGNVCLEIRDNATGIDEVLMDRVFEPFVSTKEKGANQGMGLGLTLAHWIVSAHNGEIEIKNNLLGGVTCKVTIPVDYLGSKKL
ncbi:MAG: HAMP domain-containing histidine kinase [Clostridia bacterium]|nr:HAMP domain-containing histidine kinase [Clostridia bacterium]